MAELAGVHKATASRALSVDAAGQVNADTARRVLAAARKLGYTPNTAARSLRTNRTLTVGVLLPDLTNPLFPPIVRGTEEVLMARGYTALIANTDNDPVRERRQFDALLGRQVDGFLVATALREHALLDEAHAAGLPVVLINRGTDRPLFPLVAGDDAAGVALAVEHLVELGHRTIAHLAGPAGLSTAHVRTRAFRAAVSAYGLAAADTPIVEAASYSQEAGADAAHLLLAQRPDVTAVVAGNDLIALGVLHALRASGRRCPEDVSVVGFNNMRFVDELQPPLTTIHVPHFHLGTEAARLLLEQIDRRARGEEAQLPKTILLPLHLVVRASTQRR
ncbi:LacI family DNA-binding transcriptional regulator [Streptacidiphilus sp. MAP12-16]|uniref:LacI family DNA-binding transcriptional regulator n=1 Tax=Streptacidiphilus sp. MAP12-16 TaxID=3156300 RepID=UPI0035119AE8